MILTIGWHYTKQVFGCMMVYAHFDGYPLTRSQRRVLKRALLAIWAMIFVDNNRSGAWRAVLTFSYSSLDLPDIAVPLRRALVAGGFALAAYRVVYANYTTARRLPSANLLVPLSALSVWWLPLTRQSEFYFLHGAALPLAAVPAVRLPVEDYDAGPRRGPRALVGVVAAVLLAGWLAFELVPGAFDARWGPSRRRDSRSS